MKSKRFSERCYELLIYVYPPEFRRRYRAELLEAFRAQSQQSRSPVRFWAEILRDLLASALRCWWRRAFGIAEQGAVPGHRSSFAPWEGFGFAVRSLSQSRHFTALVVATLALGIGATTGVFSILHGVLLRPLPYPEPERLVRLWDRHAQIPYFSVTAGNFADWKESFRTSPASAPQSSASAWLSGPGGATWLGSSAIMD